MEKIKRFKLIKLASLIAGLISIILFGLAFIFPVSVTDYSVDNIQKLNDFESLTTNPCEKIDQVSTSQVLGEDINQKINEVCDSTVNSLSHGIRDFAFQRTLGNIGEVTWEQCISDQGQALVAVSSMIDIPKTAVKRCFKLWGHQSMGLPLGESYLGGVIFALYERGDFALFLMLFIFTILFPLIKNLLNLYLINSSKRKNAELWYKRVSWLGKWSMADVFVISFIVVLMKFDALAFTISIESGLYIYACYTVFSIIASNLAGAYVNRNSII